MVQHTSFFPMPHNVITDCHQSGIVVEQGGALDLKNTLITACGEGLSLKLGSEATLMNVTVADNLGPGLVSDGGSNLNMSSSIVWGNDADQNSIQILSEGTSIVEYSAVQGLDSYGIQGEGIVDLVEGNASSNPSFDDPELKTLQEDSPCVDAGSPLTSNNDRFRPPGLGALRADMGWTGGADNTPAGEAGCNEEGACNYLESVVSNDGSCSYPEEWQDCDGNCLADYDEDGICDDPDSPPQQDFYAEGFSDGYELASQECAEAIALNCGPGTYWDSEYQLCLPVPQCPGDLDSDGFRAVSDLMIFLASFGLPCSE